MKKTGIVKDNRYMNHQAGPFHPESPQRLEVIYAMLEESDMAGRFQEVPVREAEKKELLLIHSPEYIDRVAATEGKPFSSLDPDTSTSPGSYEAALLASGGLCQAISMVITGELVNGFALVRPPGHHAERSCAKGEYVGIFEKILKPIALEFDPELILVSAGFDIFEDDPLGGMEVTTNGFAALTRSILNIGKACCDGKVVITLEGGYNLEGLRSSVKMVLQELAGLSETDIAAILSKADEEMLDNAVKQVFRVHGRFWKNLILDER